MSTQKSVRGKEMVTLEERVQKDFLFYQSLHEDEERIKSWDVRYSFGKVKEALESIKEMYAFVDDSRNEANVPNVMVREIHYGDDK